MPLLVLLIQNLAAQKNYNKLNMTMREALASRACCMEGVLKCYRHETLETVIDRIAKAEVGGTCPEAPPLALALALRSLYLLCVCTTSPRHFLAVDAQHSKRQHLHLSEAVAD